MNFSILKILLNKNLLLIINSIVFLIIIKLLYIIVTKLYDLRKHQAKNSFHFHQLLKIISNIICVIGLFIIWESKLNNIITVISYVSAATTIALREVILNFFAGIYIKVAKPFVIEDRIRIDDVMGDVVKISVLSFKISEISTDNNYQSIGVIVNMPNSLIFSRSLKNYTTEFKYIWQETTIPIMLDTDIDKNKKCIEKIVNNNEIIKAIPKKMEKQITNASKNIRIYYNNLYPIIYTSFEDNHILLTVRYLIHPKKVRTVENQLWIEILKAHQLKKIDLYIK